MKKLCQLIAFVATFTLTIVNFPLYVWHRSRYAWWYQGKLHDFLQKKREEEEA